MSQSSDQAKAARALLDIATGVIALIVAGAAIGMLVWMLWPR